MRNLHRYEEMFPDEFRAELERSPIAYCSFGPLEYHGPHSALGPDFVKGYEICLRAAEISGGIVYPALPVAPAGKIVRGKGGTRLELLGRDELRAVKVSYPSVFISAEMCGNLYRELFEVFAEDIGFRVCVVMGSHAPAGELAKRIAGEKGAIKGMRVIPAGSLTHNRDVIEEEYRRMGIEGIKHGGMWESAMFMASNPGFIDPGRLKSACIPSGSPDFAEISKVSSAFGERLVNTAAERIAAEALSALGEQMKKPRNGLKKGNQTRTAD